MATEEEGTKKKDHEVLQDYEVLPENYANCDLSFKIIVIGNSGKKQ